jgi:hypothetical protein
MKAPWRGEALLGSHTSMQQTAVAMVQPSLYEGFGLQVEAVHHSLKSLV